MMDEASASPLLTWQWVKLFSPPEVVTSHLFILGWHFSPFLILVPPFFYLSSSPTPSSTCLLFWLPHATHTFLCCSLPLILPCSSVSSSLIFVLASRFSIHIVFTPASLALNTWRHIQFYHPFYNTCLPTLLQLLPSPTSLCSLRLPFPWHLSLFLYFSFWHFFSFHFSFPLKYC